MALNSSLNLTGSTGLLPGVIGTVGGLLGGGTGGNTSGSGGTGTSVGGSVSTGGLLGTGLLDGLIDLKLLNGNSVANLSLLNADSDGDGLISLGLLDKDGDGLVDLSLLNKSVGLSLLDNDGDGLINVKVLDAVNVNVGGDVPDVADDLLDGSTDPAAYQVVLTGTHGHDHFTIGAKPTFVHGMGGTDGASYGKSSAGVSYKVDANGVFVSNGTKVDYLQHVERVMFSDGTLVLDTGAGETAGMAFRLYQAAFDRLPDQGGLKYWIDKLDAGTSVTAVANGFLQSPEFKMTYGPQLSNSAYVDQLYENVLGRDGEASGMKYWTDKLDSGVASRADVLIGFSESPENVALVGAKIDGGLFLT